MFWHKPEGLWNGEYLVHATDAAAPCAGQHVGLKGSENNEEHAQGAFFEHHEQSIRIVE